MKIRYHQIRKKESSCKREKEELLERRPRSGSFLRVPLQNFIHKEHVLMLEIQEKGQPFDPSNFQFFLYQWHLERCGLRSQTKISDTPGVDVMAAAQEATAILVTKNITAEWIRFLKLLKPKPILVIGDYSCNKVFPAVKIDHRAMAAEMVRAFAKEGYRKIGFINAIKSYLPSQKMHEGYVSALQECGLEYRPLELVPERNQEREMVADFMERHGNEMDAVIAERYIYYALLGAKWKGFSYEKFDSRPLFRTVSGFRVRSGRPAENSQTRTQSTADHAGIEKKISVSSSRKKQERSSHLAGQRYKTSSANITSGQAESGWI